MNADKALQILRRLAEGIDPYTGEVYPAESPYQHPDTVRALYAAIAALERVAKTEARQHRLPPNAGKPWTKAEETRLVQAFDEGRSIQQLAAEHGRTSGAITSRLQKLGKIEVPEEYRNA